VKKRKIVSDSSSDIIELDGIDFSSVPLKISTDERDFVDDRFLGVEEMTEYLDKYKGRSRTSCPNVHDWLSAFGDADEIFCITMTSKLSGTYNSACAARDTYEKENPGKRVYIIDSLSTGPEIRLITEKIIELKNEKSSAEEICGKLSEYRKNTGLYFMLKSMKNLANNGRVSHLTAKLVGIAGIHIVGRANEGELDPTDKCRGESRALERIVEHLQSAGSGIKKVKISHSMNEPAALKLKELIVEKFSGVQIDVSKCRGLCSFYAERGGMIIGYEKI